MSEIDLCLYLFICCFQCGECIGDYETINERSERSERSGRNERSDNELYDYTQYKEYKE